MGLVYTKVPLVGTVVVLWSSTRGTNSALSQGDAYLSTGGVGVGEPPPSHRLAGLRAEELDADVGNCTLAIHIDVCAKVVFAGRVTINWPSLSAEQSELRTASVVQTYVFWEDFSVNK